MISFRSLIAFLLTCLSTLLLLLGFGLYARYIEPRWVEESRWVLQSPHWQGRPLRFVVLADLHARPGDGEFIDKLVHRVVELKPDAVLLLGDYVNEPSMGDYMSADALADHLAPLAQLPCFAVLGNHDYDYGEKAVRSMLQSFGAKVLDGQVHAVEMGGDTLWLVGMHCLKHFCTPQHMQPLPPGEKNTCLMLSHSPVGAHYAPAGVVATLAAHTHGGQVCLPGGIPLVKPDERVFWQEMKGAFLVEEKPVYVTRGLGMSRMPLRLFCRPELLVVEVAGEDVAVH